jgi:RNA polymerase sigma-70 factor, ECF subfamily
MHSPSLLSTAPAAAQPLPDRAAAASRAGAAAPGASAASDALRGHLARVALGDRAALRRVYEATSAHLFGVALRICQRHDLAEDVLQEAFVNVWHHAGSYQATQAQPMTWLISIVRNKALDHLRAAQRQAADSLDDGDEEHAALQVADARPDPMELLLAAADALSIRACMESINPAQRQCLALAYFHGYSHSEVAAHLGAPLGSVKSWIRRGLERLKTCLEQAA